MFTIGDEWKAFNGRYGCVEAQHSGVVFGCWGSNAYAIIQDDGEFVIFDGKRRAMWRSNTAGGNLANNSTWGIGHYVGSDYIYYLDVLNKPGKWSV